MRAIGKLRLHGTPDHLRDEHPWSRAVSRRNLDPVPFIVPDVLRVTESARGGLQRHQGKAAHVPLRRARPNQSQ